MLYDYTLSGGDPNSEGIGNPFMNSVITKPQKFELDGGIIPSQGINENLIHLSYSGIGNDEVGGGSAGKQYNDTSNNYFGYSTITAQNHVNDIDFINAITTPGTVWRWKEDPGQCLYQTQQYNPSDSIAIIGEYDKVYGDSISPAVTPSTLNGIPNILIGDHPSKNNIEYINNTSVTIDNNH